MYFKDFIVGLRRRWYLVLIGLVVTAGLCVGIVQVVPVTYTTTSSLLMLAPKAVGSATSNPYLNLGGLTQPLDVLSIKINASTQARSITEDHPKAAIVVGADPTTPSPILLISVTAPSPEEATTVRDQLTELAPQVLVSMQDLLSIQPNSRIIVSLVAQDAKPKKVIKAQLRAVIAIAAVGGAITVLGTGYLDYFLALRSGAPVRRRRRGEQPGVDEASSADSWWETQVPAAVETSPAAAPVSSVAPEVTAAAAELPDVEADAPEADAPEADVPEADVPGADVSEAEVPDSEPLESGDAPETNGRPHTNGASHTGGTNGAVPKRAVASDWELPRHGTPEPSTGSSAADER